MTKLFFIFIIFLLLLFFITWGFDFGVWRHWNVSNVREVTRCNIVDIYDISFHKTPRLCLVIVFIFYFQKLVFGNIKKKKLLFFLNQKHVWLVEIKKKKKNWRKK